MGTNSRKLGMCKGCRIKAAELVGVRNIAYNSVFVHLFLYCMYKLYLSIITLWPSHASAVINTSLSISMQQQQQQ